MDIGQLRLDVVQEPIELRQHSWGVGLVVHTVQHRLDGRPHALRGHAYEVRHDRLDQPDVGVGGDQPDPAEAAGPEVGEELVPRRPGLARGDPHAQYLPVPVAVDAGRDQDDSVDHAAALADLHRQDVALSTGEESERAGGVEGRWRNCSTSYVSVPAGRGVGLRRIHDETAGVSHEQRHGTPPNGSCASLRTTPSPATPSHPQRRHHRSGTTGPAL